MDIIDFYAHLTSLLGQCSGALLHVTLLASGFVIGEPHPMYTDHGMCLAVEHVLVCTR